MKTLILKKKYEKKKGEHVIKASTLQSRRNKYQIVVNIK